MKRAKAKFRVGERVKLRDDYGVWLYGNVLSVGPKDPTYITVGLEYHMHQDNFRRLTKREIGPRPKVKK